MKKLLLLISASSLVFIGCQNDDDEFYTPASADSKTEKVFERGNFESEDYYQQGYFVEKGRDSIPDKDLIPWRGPGG